jgi:hypothetical protein
MTTKQYIITQDALGVTHQVDISEDDFLRLQTAHTALQNVISSEEQFDAVARNFFDLESDLLATTLEFTYIAVGDGVKNMAARRLLNRRLLNFLSAARGYMDHQRHAVKEVFGLDDLRSEQAVEMFRVAHNENFGYRLMEELRNACQHRIFPVHSVVFHVQNEREKDALHSKVEMHVNVDELRADKKFKNSVLEDLARHGKTVDLRPFVRTYVEGIAKAHQYFRENVGELTEQAGNLLQQYIARYRSTCAESNILGLHAVQVIGNAWAERVPLSTGLPEYHAYLARQNLHFLTASVKYVSSSVFNKD